MMATVCYTGQQLRWFDWLVSSRNLGTDITKFVILPVSKTHFLSQFMLKLSVYQHICLIALFVIGVS